MTPNNILIKELNFQIELDQITDFEDIANHVSELSNNNLKASLQKALDNNFKIHENIFIDTLTINVGEVDFNNYSSISKKIINSLIDKIVSLEKVNFKSNEYLLNYFIKYGFLPWWANSAKKMNDYLRIHDFNRNLKDELYQKIIRDNLSFYRLFNILNYNNKNKVLKKYLGNKFLYFQNCTLYFQNLFENSYNITSSNFFLKIQYELFKALVNNVEDNNIAFFMVLKKTIHDSKIEWEKVSKSLILKNNDNKSFSEVLNFKEELFFYNNSNISSGLSDIGHIKNYILYGTFSNTYVLNIYSLTIKFSRLLKHDRESFKIILSQLKVFSSPIKFYRISRLLDNYNIFDFISLLFDTIKSELLESTFHFIKSLEEKGKIISGTYFDFLNILLQLKNSKIIDNNSFYEFLVKVISEKYNLDSDEVLVEFYFYTSSQKNNIEYKEVIELSYNKVISKNTSELDFFLNEIEKSNESFQIFLSNYQLSQFNLIKKHIDYLNENIAFNSWSNKQTEIFIFKQLLKNNIGSKDTIVSILKTYSKENNLDIYNIIIAILSKFNRIKDLPDNEIIEFSEYIFFLNNPLVFNKLSDKEKQFLIAFSSDSKIKDKLDLLSYKYNLKVSSTHATAYSDYFKNNEVKDTLIKKKINYLASEYQQIFNGLINSKITKNQFSQILDLEIKKNILNNKFIIYERVLNSISIIIKVDKITLTKKLLKRLVNKTNFNEFDIELLNQINDVFFAFNHILNLSSNNINDFYKILIKISDESIRKSILNNYLVKSKLAVSKLTDKNYNSLITNFSLNDNVINILNNLLSLLPYQKRIELSSKIKYKALIIASKSLKQNDFFNELLNEINLMDSLTYKKLRKQIYESIKKINSKDVILNKESITGDSKKQILQLRRNFAEKKRDFLLFNLDTFVANEKEIFKQKTIIKESYKNELKALKVNDALLKKQSLKLKKTKLDYQSTNKFTEKSEDIVLELMSSHYSLPSRKYINTLSVKDFDYFLNLKKSINIEKKLNFLNFEPYNSIEDITNSNENLLEFLNLCLNDTELLFEFAQHSFLNPVKKSLESLIDSKNNLLLQVESYFLKLQKDTLFSTLNFSEYKIFIRVNIIKSLVYDIYYKNKLNISVFTLNLIETLSKNGKINYQNTAAIIRISSVKSNIEKQINKGIISYFDSNNFESINKIIKGDELLKNISHFFLMEKKPPLWCDYQDIDIKDIINFIKIKITKSDSKFIKELLLNNKIAPIVISKLKKENSSTQLSVIKLLEFTNETSFYVSELFEKIIIHSKNYNFKINLIFEHIVKNNLWEKPSLLFVFNEIYPIFKELNIHNKTGVISNLILNYPSLKLIINPKSQISDNQKLELIRFYILKGTLKTFFRTNNSLYMQILRAYSVKNKNQLKIIFYEFSNNKNIIKNFISISSKSIIEDLIIDGLNEKNIELRFLFENRIKLSSTQLKNDIILYELLINNIINQKIVKLSNLTSLFNKIKLSLPQEYKSILKIGQEQISKGKISDKKGIVFSFLNSIENKNLIINSDINEISFNNFIKELRYFVEFKSLNRLNEKFQTEQLYSYLLKFKSNLILKKQIHTWSRQEIKIKTLLKLFEGKNKTLLLDFIYPKLLDSLNTFNAILKIINHNSVQYYLNLNSELKLMLKILNIWSRQNIIINHPSEIIQILFDEVLTHSSLDSVELKKNLEKIHPVLNIEQKNLLSFTLQKSINNINENDTVLSNNSFSDENEDSIYINNAGIVIIWPFLSTLYSKLGYLEGKTFKDDYSLQKAVLILHYIVFGNQQFEESNLILNKILCGATPEFFVDTSIRFNEMEKNIGDQLLIAVTKNWDKLDNTSIVGLRESFLKRDGVIKKAENNFTLFVEKKPFDLLLKTIPWNISMIQTSFMDIRLLVEWKI